MEKAEARCNSPNSTRTVIHEGGKTIFDWQKPQKPVAIQGKWANVDGRLGVVTIAGSGLNYSQASAYNGQAIYDDVLYGSFSDQPHSFKAGDEVAHRIVILLTEVTPGETSALAQSAKVDGSVLRFTLPEGDEGDIPLLRKG